MKIRNQSSLGVLPLDLAQVHLVYAAYLRSHVKVRNCQLQKKIIPFNREFASKLQGVFFLWIQSWGCKSSVHNSATFPMVLLKSSK